MSHWPLVAGGFVVAALLMTAPPPAISADAKYQPRGHHWEGVRSELVSGFNVELLSATVDYSERPVPLAEKFHVQFFLEKPRSEVYLVVRELDNLRYYWLDKVKPSSPWQQGFGNVFEWPTAAVIRPLGLNITQLGVVTRLDSPEPKPEEKVAPAILFQAQPPEEIKGYRFVFKLLTDAKDVKAQVFSESDLQRPLWTRDLGKRSGQTPIEVVWPTNSPAIATGWYRVVLDGFSLGSGRKVSQVVQFYHQPRVR